MKVRASNLMIGTTTLAVIAAAFLGLRGRCARSGTCRRQRRRVDADLGLRDLLDRRLASLIGLSSRSLCPYNRQSTRALTLTTQRIAAGFSG